MRAALLIGPKGIGKTSHSEEIAALLDCTHIIDDWDATQAPPPGALAITDHRPPFSLLDAYLVDLTRIHICPNHKSLKATIEDLRYSQRIRQVVEGRA